MACCGHKARVVGISCREDVNIESRNERWFIRVTAKKSAGLYKRHKLTVDRMSDLVPCYGGRGAVRIAIVCTWFGMILADKVKKLRKSSLGISGSSGE
jgi:hypothetical protein